MISPSNTDKSDKDLWATPKQAFNGFERYLSEIYDGFTNFTLDACALPHNTKVERFISPSQNTFKTDWGNGEFVWMNPPYSYPLAFIERAIEMSEKTLWRYCCRAIHRQSGLVAALSVPTQLSLQQVKARASILNIIILIYETKKATVTSKDLFLLCSKRFYLNHRSKHVTCL